MKTQRYVLSLVLLVAVVLPAAGLDWPQWRGLNRDGVSKETGLLKDWPKDGPPLRWTFADAGLGFSGPAVVGDRLYTMGARAKGGEWTTYLIALDISGKQPKELWACPVGPMYRDNKNYWGDGPRSTPTVDGDFVYALGGKGDLICAAAKDGKLGWKKNLNTDLGGEMMTYWGNCESVLVDGDHVICTPGGPKGTLAALNKKTGEVVWRSAEITDKATYASVMPAQIGGVKQYVAVTFINGIDGGALAGVGTDGKKLWYQKFFTGDVLAACPSPLVDGDEVYATVVTNCKLLKVKKADGTFTVEDLYPKKNQKVMKNAHGGVVHVGKYVYGESDKRGLVCQDWKTGKEVWSERNRLEGESFAVIAAEGNLYLYSEMGECVLLRADPKAWDEHGRFTVPKQFKVPAALKDDFTSARLWTHPVIANGMLYLREQNYFYCYDIRAKK